MKKKFGVSCRRFDIYFFVAFFSFICAQDYIDLEKHPQDFVIGTKQIVVPGYPGHLMHR